MTADHLDDDSDDHDDEAPSRRSNLLPAIVVAAAALVAGQMAASGGDDPVASAGAGVSTIATVATTPATVPAPTTTIDIGPLWSYRPDETGPPHWATLDSEWSLCETGTEQSPIEIERSTGGSIPLGFVYGSVDGTITFDGRLAQIGLEPGSGITVDGVFYDLERAELHTPSEHVVASEGFAAELQLYHQAADGTRAVVAVMIGEGAHNELLDPIFKGIDTQGGHREPLYGPLQLADVLPEDRSMAHYAGSLTTPPCTESVSWYVMTTPISASQDQIDQAVAAVPDGSARPLQPIGDRVITAESSASEG